MRGQCDSGVWGDAPVETSMASCEPTLRTPLLCFTLFFFCLVHSPPPLSPSFLSSTPPPYLAIQSTTSSFQARVTAHRESGSPIYKVSPTMSTAATSLGQGHPALTIDTASRSRSVDQSQFQSLQQQKHLHPNNQKASANYEPELCSPSTAALNQIMADLSQLHQQRQGGAHSQRSSMSSPLALPKPASPLEVSPVNGSRTPIMSSSDQDSVPHSHSLHQESSFSTASNSECNSPMSSKAKTTFDFGLHDSNSANVDSSTNNIYINSIASNTGSHHNLVATKQHKAPSRSLSMSSDHLSENSTTLSNARVGNGEGVVGGSPTTGTTDSFETITTSVPSLFRSLSTTTGRKQLMGKGKQMGSLPTIHHRRGRRKW